MATAAGGGTFVNTSDGGLDTYGMQFGLFLLLSFRIFRFCEDGISGVHGLARRL
jgi:hypothetical protein